MATGARQDELLQARRDDVDHDRRQLTVTGKRGKRRTIALDPFEGYDLPALPAYVGHRCCSGIRRRALRISPASLPPSSAAPPVGEANGVDFRPFRYHDLRHWHAVHWLKIGPLDLRATAPARPYQREDDRGLSARGLSDVRGASRQRARSAQKPAQPLRMGQRMAREVQSLGITERPCVSGLANRRLQPLGHLSVGEMSLFQRVLMVKAERI